jgi:phospholipase C
VANNLGKIDHIVEVMLENRSFDHRLGFLYKDSGNKSLSDKKIDWAIFGYNRDPLAQHDFPDTQNASPDHFGHFRDFQERAANGTLPAFTFLEPSWDATGNSQHPNYDVSLGEQFLHDVYYALQTGKNWASTLLIITYDEHGGCYDHVAPPPGATPPGDGTVGEFGFDFTRFGVRVPAVLVSPSRGYGLPRIKWRDRPHLGPAHHPRSLGYRASHATR